MNAHACIAEVEIPRNARNRSGRRDRPAAADVAPGRLSGRLAARSVRRGFQSGGPAKKTDQEDLVWVAATGCRVVGMIRLAANGRDDAHVRRVRVDPEWRHTSVVTGLIDQVRAFCQRRGYTRIEFEPGSAPAWFQALAARRGFGNLRSSS